MSTRTHDNFNLGKKVLLDARLEPVFTFTNLPDPNLPSNYIPKGGIILVEDTSKNYQAQEDPGNIPNLIWVDISVPSAGIITGVAFIELPYANIDVLRAAGTLVKGAFYRITDRADNGIVVQAVSTSELSLSGNASYLLADYNGNGDYTNAPLALNSRVGVWNASYESGMINGDVAIWDGNNYQVQSDSSFDGTSPSVNTTAYFMLPKDITKGYTLEVDFVKYDFVNDSILERSDKRGNVVSATGVPFFQWGNDSTFGNTVLNLAKYDCINNTGIIQGNLLSGSVTVITNNVNVGTIRNSRFNCAGYTYTCNETTIAQVLLDNCDVSLNANIKFNSTSQYANMTCDYAYSTFSEDINMSTSFSLGILTIPAAFNYVGIFRLTNNNGQTISKILNAPLLFKIRFRVTVGNNQNFVHTAVASAVLGNMVADVTSTNNIVGRLNLPDDIIEYENGSSGILRRYNIVKLA